MDSAIGSQLLETLGTDIVQVRVDLTQNAETYYFPEAQAEASLPAMIFYAVELGEKARLSHRPGIRLGGTVMSEALDDLAEYMSGKFIAKGDSTKEVFKSFAADHGYTCGSTN